MANDNSGERAGKLSTPLQSLSIVGMGLSDREF